jgi:hypothetical protein
LRKAASALVYRDMNDGLWSQRKTLEQESGEVWVRTAGCSVAGDGRARLEWVLDVPQLQARPPMITKGMHLSTHLGKSVFLKSALKLGVGSSHMKSQHSVG